jgi:universal stress protein A
VVAEKVARRKLAELAREHLRTVRYETILHVSDHPAKIILEVEKEVRADALIMATHGFTGLFHLLLGSLTEKMVREATCPVLSICQRLDGPLRPAVWQERSAA